MKPTFRFVIAETLESQLGAIDSKGRFTRPSHQDFKGDVNHGTKQ